MYIFWNNYPSSVILSQIHSLSLNDNGLSIEVQKDSDTSLWSSDDRALGVVSSEGHSSPSYPHSGGGQFGSRLLVKGKISSIRMDSESIDISFKGFVRSSILYWNISCCVIGTYTFLFLIRVVFCAC